MFPREALLVDVNGVEVQRGAKIATLRKAWEKMGAVRDESLRTRHTVVFRLPFKY